MIETPSGRAGHRSGGFSRSHLAERLLALGHDVRVDCFTPIIPGASRRPIWRAGPVPGFRFRAGSGRETIGPLLTGREWVFHQAAQPGVRASWEDGLRSVRRAQPARHPETAGGCAWPRSALRVRLVVLGVRKRARGAVPRTAPASDLPYGVTKLAAEQLVMVYHREFGLPR
jgi:nucleoside-diphosphate-sugar epimerase